MRSSLSLAGRRASVLAAAAVVSLTAACGPADFTLGAAGTTGSAAGQADAPGEIGAAQGVPADAAAPEETAVVPGEEVPRPVPSATPPADAMADTAPIEPVEPAGGDLEEPAAEPPTQSAAEAPAEVAPETKVAVGTDTATEAEQVADTSGTARNRESSSRRSVDAPVAGGTTTAAAVAPAAAGGTTGGSGGSYNDQQRQSFTARNGLSGRYLLYAGGVDPARPVALVVYADGTGEYGVDNPTSSYALGGSAGLVANARSRNAITLAVESPNQSCECWHTGDTNGYADFLAELIEKQLASYPIDEVWLTGFSSGAQEVTRFLVPRHPELLRLGGGWVVFGGGGPPASSGSAVTAARMAGVRGHWYTGTADTAVPLTASWGAQAGERWYAGRGVATSHEWPAGVGHSLDGRLGRTVGQQLDAS